MPDTEAWLGPWPMGVYIGELNVTAVAGGGTAAAAVHPAGVVSTVVVAIAVDAHGGIALPTYLLANAQRLLGPRQSSQGVSLHCNLQTYRLSLRQGMR